MSWKDQNPPATNVLLSGRIYVTRKSESIHFEIDKLADGIYRATIGNLFGSREIIRGRNLEHVLHAVEKLHGPPLSD